MRPSPKTACLLAATLIAIASFLPVEPVSALQGCCKRTFTTGGNCILSENTSQAACEAACNPIGEPPCTAAEASLCAEGEALVNCQDALCQATCATYTPTATPTSTPTATPTNTPASDGAPCVNGEGCVSTNCVDGVCCADASCPEGQSCNNPAGPGMCTSDLPTAAPVASTNNTLLLALLLGVVGTTVLRRRFARR